MFNSLTDGRRPAAVALGWSAGLLMGLLLAAPAYRRALPPPAPTPSPALPDSPAPEGVERDGRALLEALPGLCEGGSPAAVDDFLDLREQYAAAWRLVRAGIRRADRLLPLARRLTLEALREAGAFDRMSRPSYSAVRRNINAVRRVVLDPQLGDAGEVSDERPWEIRIGPEYAVNLLSDEDAVLLLSHELTHVASWTGELDGFVEAVSDRARLAAGVEPVGRQKMDLACDYLAALAVKRFIDRGPTDESKAERLTRALRYQTPSERLRLALENFCTTYAGYPGDEEHLGQWQMLRALRGLHPELEALIPAAAPSAPP